MPAPEVLASMARRPRVRLAGRHREHMWPGRVYEAWRVTSACALGALAFVAWPVTSIYVLVGNQHFVA